MRASKQVGVKCLFTEKRKQVRSTERKKDKAMSLYLVQRYIVHMYVVLKGRRYYSIKYTLYQIPTTFHLKHDMPQFL